MYQIHLDIFTILVFQDYTHACALPFLCKILLYFSAAVNIGSALVWGTSVKHQPQKVGRDHVLNDEDVVQIVKKL